MEDAYIIIIILLYNSIIKPICVYEIELWGCASKYNIDIIQIIQSKIVRMIADLASL